MSASWWWQPVVLEKSWAWTLTAVSTDTVSRIASPAARGTQTSRRRSGSTTICNSSSFRVKDLLSTKQSWCKCCSRSNRAGGVIYLFICLFTSAPSRPLTCLPIARFARCCNTIIIIINIDRCWPPHSKFPHEVKHSVGRNTRVSPTSVKSDRKSIVSTDIECIPFLLWRPFVDDDSHITPTLVG